MREQQMMDSARLAEMNSRTVDISKKEVFMSAYIQGWKDADSHPHWIPVEKELPKENEEVLAYNAENEEVIACDYHHKMFHCWPEAFKESITHWMPKPMPPTPRKEV